MTTLAPTIETFFTHRLTIQRDASPHTIAAYRDTLRLLLVFARDRTGKQPSLLDVADIDAPLVAAFLTHLETERGNSVSTRNTRLTAIHSLFRHAALRHPEHAESIQRVLAIPAKRHDQKIVSYLVRDEIDALLAAPDAATWFGRRDQTLLTLAVQTGMRVSELTRLVRADLHLCVGAYVRCHGKERKERATPLSGTRATRGSGAGEVARVAECAARCRVANPRPCRSCGTRCERRIAAPARSAWVGRHLRDPAPHVARSGDEPACAMAAMRYGK